jgi:hypothetical protein
MLEGCLPEYADVIQNKTTPEKLWSLMANRSGQHGRSHIVLNISEMVTFFGREGYSMGMPVMLTDLYDCPNKREGGGSINYGTLPLINPFITFLAGSTPSWLARAINPDVIEGGFTSRVIFVNSDARKKLIFWPDELQRPNIQAAKEYLNAIRDHAIQLQRITLTDEAKAFLTKWYGTRTFNSDTYSRSFESREDSHVLRLAGTIALSKLGTRIGLSEVELALYAISRAKKSGRAIFKSAVSNLKLANGLDKIREVLLKRGLYGINNKELHLRVRYLLGTMDYNGVMGILVDTGAVKTYQVANRRGDKSTRFTRFYIATTKILDKKTWNDVLSRSGQVNEDAHHQPDEKTPELPSSNSPALEDHTSSQTPSHSDLSSLPSIDLSISYTSGDLKR